MQNCDDNPVIILFDNGLAYTRLNRSSAILREVDTSSLDCCWIQHSMGMQLVEPELEALKSPGDVVLRDIV